MCLCLPPYPPSSELNETFARSVQPCLHTVIPDKRLAEADRLATPIESQNAQVCCFMHLFCTLHAMNRFLFRRTVSKGTTLAARAQLHWLKFSQAQRSQASSAPLYYLFLARILPHTPIAPHPTCIRSLIKNHIQTTGAEALAAVVKDSRLTELKYVCCSGVTLVLRSWMPCSRTQDV